MYKKLPIPKSTNFLEERILEKSFKGIKFSREELAYLLYELDSESLYALADKIRKEQRGNLVFLRAIIEFSNYCRNNCLYCGIRRDNKELKRYRMKEKEILAEAEKLVLKGFKTIVLQSGEDPLWDAKRLSKVVKEIKKFGVAVTLSVGELDYKDYAILREAGADRYLLKHETIDKKLFSWLKPDTTLEKRIRCLFWLKELEYEVGAGCIIGLPGQTLDSLIDDLLFLQELKPDMVGHGPFIPHPKTPLAGFPYGNPELVLKIVALTRIILPYANIPATTALGVINPVYRIKAFYAGANVIMPDLTPEKYKTFYEIYPGKGIQKFDLNGWLETFRKMGRKTDLSPINYH
ncbi:MAG: [FeFe] hydrogenase H-cluster radical SAM maturase HydE [Thermodesulfobacterium geofontis]|uniref:[FeFe] hydrogenase H-cluster radical SAM maturase HydE n=1 Tax=Thermodesulfobacterium geofontis TaxID=1295609 RepID=A0A2N7PLM1_9BACT|nr:MAG: [FeFe] hydrogenase H-cluster radical SAM maturase HydE [Thermodesulfobacterium geofontis]